MTNVTPEQWVYYQNFLTQLKWILPVVIFLLLIIRSIQVILKPMKENIEKEKFYNTDLTIEQKIKKWSSFSKRDLEKAYELAMLSNNEEEMTKIKYFLDKKKNHEWVWIAAIVLLSIKGIL